MSETPTAENDAPSWNMGCGHFDTLNDPAHDCSTWTDEQSFAERVGDRHFPWHYTSFGVLCCCGRPCDAAEECAVVRRARRWSVTQHDTLIACIQSGRTAADCRLIAYGSK